MKKLLILLLLPVSGCVNRPDPALVHTVRRFIADNWETTVQYAPRDTGTLIGLPYPYTVPTAGEMFREMYYWDTFFTNEGLVRDGRADLARNNTENLLSMVRRFGKVYNGSRTYYEARSQPPYLAMMVARIYRTTGDRAWLEEAYETLRREYDFWMRERMTPVGLNRYGSSASDALIDEFLVTAGKRLGTDFHQQGYTQAELRKLGLDFVAEAESGWDFNPRFERRCGDFCPLDLNANLFGYEVEFARFARELGREAEAAAWIARAEERRARILRYCYDPVLRQFYDYDHVNDRRSEVLSAAVFSLLFHGAVPREYAPRIVAALDRLEYDFGIAACEDKPYPYAYQWSWPNSWPPACFCAVAGLARYGFDREARRIAANWVRGVSATFRRTGNLWEKYNAVDGSTDVYAEYETPAMLGWTAGTFICFDDFLNGSFSPEPLPEEFLTY